MTKTQLLIEHLRAAAQIAEELQLVEGGVMISSLLSCLAEDIEDPVTDESSAGASV